MQFLSLIFFSFLAVGPLCLASDAIDPQETQVSGVLYMPVPTSPFDFGLDLRQDLLSIRQEWRASQITRWAQELRDTEWCDQFARSKLLRIYRDVKEASTIWEPQKVTHMALVTLEGETLLRLANNRRISFPLYLEGEPRSRKDCAAKVIALGRYCANHTLSLKGYLALVKHTPEDFVLCKGGAAMTKSALLLSSYLLLSQANHGQKILTLIALLEYWTGGDIVLNNQIFYRQTYVQMLFHETLGQHTPLNLRLRAYNTLKDHWRNTYAFTVDGYIVKKNTLDTVAGQILSRRLQAQRGPESVHVSPLPLETTAKAV
ncbi:MAG: hypothetical protein C0514_01020 [Candidatus Puniceispirillum sp.]|nr:hypothetical protein [Candidatus Puniceispirillum sp.]